MRESGAIFTECLVGFLRTTQPADADDRDALHTLREQTRGAREATTGYLRSIKANKKATTGLRKQNFSRSLNEATTQLEEHLEDAVSIVRKLVRGFKAGERRMTRRLFVSRLRETVRRN